MFSSFGHNLIILLIMSVGMGIALTIKLKGVQFHTDGTDNELMAYAAAQSHRWKWLSDLHKLSHGRTGMKDMSVILISVFQKILRDKTTDRPYLTLGAFCNVLSTILIYFIASNYWGPQIGLFVALLFLFSLWGWEIALYGGHVNVATSIFLLSVYFAQQINSDMLNPMVLLVLAGFLFGFLQFASASAMKYSPLFFASLAYTKYAGSTVSDSIDKLIAVIADNYNHPVNMLILVLFLLSLTISWLSYRKVVIAIYREQAPGFLNKIIEGRDKFSLDFYLKLAKEKMKRLTVWGVRLMIALLVLINLIGIFDLSIVFLGSFVAFLVLTLPDIKKIFQYYLDFFLETHWRRKTHFRIYVNYFAKKGITVSRNTRGAGLPWIPRIFYRMAPLHSILFILSLTLIILMAAESVGTVDIFSMSIVLLLSLSPVLWAEITKAPQISRAFLPGLVGVLLFIGFSLRLFQYPYENLWMPFILSFLAITLVWNIWKFVSDVYPARMAVKELIKAIDLLNIKDLYTYKTNYNKAFVNELFPALTKRVRIHYINSINEVNSGWIAIPGTSSKALNMESEVEAIDGGDFTKDPVLNRLIESKEIAQKATRRFKTYGTSTIWVQENEVSSYRDLIIKEVTEADRWRGYAWLIHTDNLKS